MISFDIIQDAYPVLVNLLCLYILRNLYKINKFTNGFQIVSLYAIPISFIILYMWIGLFDPAQEVSRPWVRIALFFSFGNASVYTKMALEKLRKKK